MAILKINGKAIMDPSKMSYTISDMDSDETFRSLTGELIRDRITTKVKLECSWNAMDVTSMSTLLTAMQDVFFQLTYFDAKAGKELTKTFYVGDRTASIYSVIDGKIVYQSFSANFIER